MDKSFFEFTEYRFSPEEGKAFFSYRLGSPDGQEYEFTETLIFSDLPDVTVDPKLLDKALSAVHMALGISYYKLYCPTDLRIKTGGLSKDQAEFWGKIYRESEIMQLYYGFQLSVDDRGRFPIDEKLENNPVNYNFKNRSLVLFGGGKDSLVSYDLINNSEMELALFNFDRFVLHDKLAVQLDVPRIVVERRIDPFLFEMNKLDGVYSGRMAHIPIPTIIAFVASLVAVLYDYRFIVFSNEQSANIGNVSHEGVEVNHQWSKSEYAEKLTQDYIRSNISPDLICFSLLRPFHEIEIVHRFSQLKKYHHIFSSCNRNFTLVQKSQTDKLWCCECEKCAFVFALLSAYLPKQELVSIFGQNLHEKESLLQTFKDLLGMGDMKPFECVGTPEETIVALYMASQNGEYKDTFIMKQFENNVLPTVKSIEDLKSQVFKYGDDSLMPERFRKIIS